MALWRCILLGACGGALVEVLAVLGYVRDWQRARRTSSGTVKKSPPRMRIYIDIPVHLWLLFIRMPLGSGTAWLFASTGQISGPYAMLALGVAAPAVLAHLGKVREVEQMVRGNAGDNLLPTRAATAGKAALAPSEEVERP